jgi:hypothetical protein
MASCEDNSGDSLIEPGKRSAVEPKRYLVRATRAALADRTAVRLPTDACNRLDTAGEQRWHASTMR